MTLYRKYRPRSFAEVVGQEHIVTTLENAVERDQLVHAYLFFGPRGTGKTSVARILAKILLIRGIEDETIQKQIVKSVDDGTMVDLIEIDAASNRGIDDVRELKEKVEFAPNVASAKIYIIDEVHMMTKEAFNALLKTLEEPPAHAFFILATTELHKVPDTIQSRCQRFPFRDITEENIVRALQNIADREHINIDRAALRAIASHVGGGMRDAVVLLDQLSSLEKVTEEEVRSRIGESTDEEVEALWEALESHDRKAALEITSSLEEKGASLEVFLRQLLSRARRDMHERIEKKESTEESSERIDAIFQALKDMRVSPVPSVALEVALVDLCAEEGEEPKKKKEKVEKKEKKAKEAKESKEVKVSKEAKEAKVSKEAKEKKEAKDVEEVSEDATVVAKDVTKDGVESLWDDIVSSVSSASVRMSLKDASVESVEDGKATLSFSSGFHRDKVQETKARLSVETAFKEHFHCLVPVECVLRTGGDEAPSDSGQKDDVNMVEAVAEIFG